MHSWGMNWTSRLRRELRLSVLMATSGHFTLSRDKTHTAARCYARHPESGRTGNVVVQRSRNAEVGVDEENEGEDNGYEQHRPKDNNNWVTVIADCKSYELVLPRKYRRNFPKTSSSILGCILRR